MEANQPLELSTTLIQNPLRRPTTLTRLHRKSDTLVEIGDIDRFASPEQLVSYGRLAPRVHQSGQGRPQSGPLSKSGSRLLGRAAVEAAQHAWRESNPWHDLYLDVGRRSRHTNAAKAAVARTILIAVWHMLSRNQPFKPAPRTTEGTSVPASSRVALAA
jgi:transposase